MELARKGRMDCGSKGQNSRVCEAEKDGVREGRWRERRRGGVNE